jgi:hypothetical protein
VELSEEDLNTPCVDYDGRPSAKSISILFSFLSGRNQLLSNIISVVGNPYMEPAGEEGKVGGEEQGCRSSNGALHLVSVGFNYLFVLSWEARN